MQPLYHILLVLVNLHKTLSKDVAHAGYKGGKSLPKYLQEPNRYVLKMSPCGKPLPGNESACQSFSKLQYPNCQSFPGKPSRVEVLHKIHNHTTYPKIIVKWDAPSTGFNDLWAFQVSINDLTLNHPGWSSECKQINIKAKRRFSTEFNGLLYGGHYEITVKSMPPDGNSNVTRYLTIPDKCSIPDFRLTRLCCRFSKVNYEVNKSTIHDTPRIYIRITWELKCNYINGIQQFNLKWNTTDGQNCCGIANTTNNNYTIILPNTCTQKQQNYTAEIYGITPQGTTTEIHKFGFTASTRSSSATTIAPTSRSQPTSADIKIIIAVVISTGTVIGILLVVLLFKIFRRAPVIRIVDYNLADNAGEQILPDPIKVLILYASCCMQCKKVIYCLWDVLNCTSLFDISLDMLSEPKLNENPLRWYELQVKDAARIILVTSRLMMAADMNPTDTIETAISDYVSIVYQLNLLRGELSNTTDMSKFVPVYMSYNGSKRDIPRFLSVCRTYKLAPELDKIMMHLLGMSSIRKHSQRPVLQIGSDDHPYNEKREALDKAITDADYFHQLNFGQCPNTHSNHVV